MAKELTNAKPTVPNAFEEELLRKRLAVRYRQNEVKDLQLHFRDENGKPCDLSELDFLGSSNSSESLEGAEYSVQVRFREGTERDPKIYSVTGEMVTPEEGLAQCRIPQQYVSCVPGVWLAEFGILDQDGCLVKVQDCYVYVEKSAWGDTTTLGPPQVQSIRQAMADDDPIINELLDNYEFDLGDICYATIRTVEDWNDTPPPVRAATYTTKNFPFRHIWQLGIKIYLLRRAELHYRRNFYPYNAGGMTRDDKNRHREYTQAWRLRQEEYKKLLIHKKVELNAKKGFMSQQSGYAYTYNSAID